MTIATESLVPDGKLHVWNIERDTVTHYDFINRNGDASEPGEASKWVEHIDMLIHIYRV